MKRHATVALVGAMTLAAGFGIAGLTQNAQANRAVSLETSQIASVDVFALVDRALSTDDMLKARQDFETQSNTEMSKIQQQMQDLQTQASTLGQDDPQLQSLYQQYQGLQSQYDYQTKQASAEYQKLIANQISTAYKAIYGAANEIGAQNGYLYVFASRSTDELLQTDTITGITQEILARPLMTPPSATDLTEMVRVKLGYPEKPAEDAATDLPGQTGAGATDASGDAAPSEEQPASDPMDENGGN